MRRPCALIVLLMFASVPALQLHCAIVCQPRAAAHRSTVCPYHHHDANGPVLSRSGDDCVAAVVAPTLATIAAERPPMRPALVVERLTSTVGARTAALHTFFVALSHGRPPGVVGAPLRI